MMPISSVLVSIRFPLEKQSGPGHLAKDAPARSGLDMHFRIAAERVTVECLKERVERRK
jgi:hypothetical protein